MPAFSRPGRGRHAAHPRLLLAAAASLLAIAGCADAPARPDASGPATPSPPARSEAPSIPSPENWRLVWNDEFDGSDVDRSHWSVRHRSTFGDGNREIACLMDRPENVRVQDGMLTLTARREAAPVPCGDNDVRFPAGRSYTTGFVETRDLAEFAYGRFEVRARLPIAHGTSKGLWPAFWLRPSDMTIGEIDVLEGLGSAADQPDTSDRVLQSIHYDYDDTHPMQSRLHVLESGAFSDEFHTFVLEWEPGSLRWFVDDTLTYERTAGTTPWLDEAFSRPFFLRLNLAVGGSWPGEPDAATSFPAEYEIDYVRVYQR